MTAFLFAKYHGAGNDFILIDDRHELFPCADQNYIEFLCKRHLGIGADGVILFQNSEKADLRVRIFNADGLEADMCGNGLRCAYDLASNLGLVQSRAILETAQRVVSCEKKDEDICVDLGPYEWIHQNLQISPLHFQVIHTGVPHAVAFVENHDLFASIAPEMRFHPLMGPAGANVSFAVMKDGKLYTRTCERGVGETMACGSGAAAIAIAAQQKYGLSNSVTIVPRSQEELKVHISSSSVQLLGKANFVFQGLINY